jgi:hypothetical protein
MAKILPKSLGFFTRKKIAQRHKKLPNWQNFAQSGHPVVDVTYRASLKERQPWVDRPSFLFTFCSCKTSIVSAVFKKDTGAIKYQIK